MGQLTLISRLQKDLEWTRSDYSEHPAMLPQRGANSNQISC